MARELSEIKNQITSSFIENETVIAMYGLDPEQTFEQQFSLVSIENIIFDVVSFAIWFLESLWDVFRREIQEKIDASKPFTLKWYKAVALAYQHGFALNEDGDYINGTATAEEIEASKIVAQVAFEKAVINGHGVLRCKTARAVDGDLAPLSPEQLEGFDFYMNKKTAFGVRVVCVSRQHDLLRLDLKIWYNPQILDAEGKRKDGTNDTPVLDAINEYLRNIEFNGQFVKTFLTDAIQKVEGVEIPKIIEAESHWVQFQNEDQPYNGIIEEIRQTHSGYMRLDVGNTNIEYIPYE